MKDDEARHSSRNYFVLCLVILALTFGEAVWVTGLSFLTQGSSGRFGLPKDQEGLYATSFFAGQVISSVFFGWVADARGRRFALMCSLFTSFAGGLLSAFAPVSEGTFGFVPLLSCCLLAGVGVGGAVPVTQSYVVEYFPSSHRGLYTCLASLGWPIGGVISTVLAWMLFPPESITPAFISPSSSSSSSSSTSTHGWTLVCFTNSNTGSSRWPVLYMWLGGFNTLVLVLIFIYLPKSPHFIRLTTSTTTTPTYTARQLLSSPLSPPVAFPYSLYKTFSLLGIIWFAVSSSGNGFSTFLPVFLKELQTEMPNVGAQNIYTTLILSSLVGIPGVTLASFAVESTYFGRKSVCFVSTLLASLSFVLFLGAKEEWEIIGASCLQNFVIQSSWAAVVCLTSEVGFCLYNIYNECQDCISCTSKI